METWRTPVVLFILLLAATLIVSACDNAADDDDDDAADDDADDDDDSDDDEEEPYYDPRELGPYQVGVTTLVLIDQGRWDPATQSARTLPVEVWYPATDQTADLPRDTVRGFLGDWDEYVLQLFAQMGATPEDLANFDNETGAVRDAQLESGDAPYPMVLFSHGFGGIRFQNYTQCEYLASHGFIVAAPDHTGNALVTTLPDEVIEFREDLESISLLQRKADFSFLLDAFTGLSALDPDGRLTGAIQTERFGGMGHSFGGRSIAETTKDDQRLAAAINMASYMLPRIEPTYDTSMMFMIALEDVTMADVIFLMRWDYTLVPPPKFKLELHDAGHYTFSDSCILLPSIIGNHNGCGTGERLEGGEPFEFIDHDAAFAAINAYTVAFFSFNLRDDQQAADLLTENLFPDRLDWEYQLQK
ncbi:MAG: hypothetical protein P9M14_02730 [Candidatus Alcyoniella australis]|nr:hypothetical protein [Candidatus Alcyoniella australis]